MLHTLFSNSVLSLYYSFLKYFLLEESTLSKLLKILFGSFVVALGVIILQHSDLLTGGTAGLSLGLMYIFNMPFSLFFFIINIPFYIFSFITMGWRFTVSTILAVSFLSLMTSIDIFLPHFVIPSLLGATLGGVVIGLGVSYLFITGASLGGAHILALFLQKKFNFNPGKVSFSFDFSVILISLFTVGIINGMYSILSIVILSSILSYFKGNFATASPNKTMKESKTYSPTAKVSFVANS
ncbi:hypothetical protein CR203_17310 [Salipaludibacillus neizhouensis]|uniref:YitT family protein n=1 Tax=Salipaludibacillus neizhouensis TaxID=885475 RepID=A0A3A9K6D2_9BACI|nr:hypothetical protein CR203_17310 [Salipaludibacillus neizhouensis]